ncbi:MAG: glutathione S-transferase C-terminal domain-containing protein [Paracoccaceae bacterium]
MGMLIDGMWCRDTDQFIKDGTFTRETSELTNPTPQAIADRLQAGATSVTLVVSQSCPWSHRTTLVRAHKGVDDIPLSVATGTRNEGYAVAGFNTADTDDSPVQYVHQFYSATLPSFTGRATVPLLCDRNTRTVLCNSSATIARALDRVGSGWRLVPDRKIAEIDVLNARIYNGLANAVYRAGFATTQKAHAEAVTDVFATLDWLETLLSARRCLVGDQITEADLFLFATLVRFDSVYAPLFRCTRRRLTDYPALWAYARDLYAWPGIAATFDFDANLRGYFWNDTDTNPHRIVPELPDVDWTQPHGRDRLGPLTIWCDGAWVHFDAVSKADHAA